MSYMQQIWLLIAVSVAGGFFLRSLISDFRRNRGLAAFDTFMVLASLGVVTYTLDALWDHEYLNSFLNSITEINIRDVILLILACMAVLVIALVVTIVYALGKPHKQAVKPSQEKPKASKKTPTDDLLTEVQKSL